MKKYIKPTIEIEISDLDTTLLAGLSKYDTVGGEEEFGNTASFDENDDMEQFMNKNLWED